MRRDGETVLYLADRGGRVQPVPGSLLLERLGRLRSAAGLPHFIFLSTCETAPAEAERGVGGLGQRLVRELGVPAVLAMSGKVGLDLALALAQRFYPRLLVHGEPDRALAEVNAALVSHTDALIPVIYSRLRAQPLFELTAGPSELAPAEVARALSRLGELLPTHAPGALADLEELTLTLRGAALAGPQTAQATARAQARLAALCEETLELPLRELLREAAAGPERAKVAPARCPFPGLNAFQSAEAEFFFGRERLVERMVERLLAHGFLAVLGPSGSGKSSIVLAGVVPALRRQLPGLQVARCAPGRSPRERLQRAVSELVPSGGGHWAVQGPIAVDSALAVGQHSTAYLGLISMAVAVGEGVANMIQPFWLLPLLAIAKLHVRQVMGFTVVAFLIGFVVLGGATLIAPLVL